MLFRDIDLFEIQTLVNQLLNKHDIHASDYDRKKFNYALCIDDF